MKKSEERSSHPKPETPTRRSLRHTLPAIVDAWLAAASWRRAFAWLSVALPSLWLFFPTRCLSILYSIVSSNPLNFEGSYSITMLALATILPLLKRAFLIVTPARNKGRPDLARSLPLGILLIVASLQLHSLSAVGLVPSILTMVFFLLGLLILAFPEASNLIFAFLCLYILAVSLPTFMQAFLNEQSSALYILCSMPFLGMLGYSAQTAGQVIGFVSSSGGAVTMNVDSSCAGSGCFSVFLFLSGLMYLVTRAGKKRTLLLVSAGSIALYLVNVLRLVALVHIGYTSSAEAMWQAHSYLGYVLFLPFYIVYLLVFLRLAQRGSSKTNAVVGKNAPGAPSS